MPMLRGEGPGVGPGHEFGYPLTDDVDAVPLGEMNAALLGD